MDWGADATTDAPAHETPRDLSVAWLQFHEAGLCQGIDAAFRFHGKAMEVRCLVVEEKSYEKLAAKFTPLRASYEIDIIATRPAAVKKPAEEKSPPPSLWNNSELRTYLQEHTTWAIPGAEIAEPVVLPGERDHNFSLKQRMTMFADLVLDLDKKMKRHGVELPSLVSVARDPAVPRDLRVRAASICLAHAQSLEKQAERLGEYLAHAFPRVSKGSSSSIKRPRSSGSPADRAAAISRTAQDVARQIYRLIHPVHYTVGLEDLRDPSLLESLMELRSSMRDFQASLGKD